MIPKPFIGNDLGYFAKFDEGAVYTLPDDGGDDDNLDWNKLPGFSGCTVFHHNSSVRAGWRPSQNRIVQDIKECIQLSAYIYDKGELLRDWDNAPYKREVLLLNDENQGFYVAPGEWFGVRIIDQATNWLFGVGKVDPVIAFSDIVPRVSDIVERRISRFPKTPCSAPPVRSRLNPYFGGDRKSPNKVNMKIAYVKGWEAFEA